MRRSPGSFRRTWTRRWPCWAERGWLLIRDGGVTLLDSTPGGTRGVEVAALIALVRDYAAVQRRTVARRDELVAAGLRVADPVLAAP